jgi:hypothetical protein
VAQQELELHDAYVFKALVRYRSMVKKERDSDGIWALRKAISRPNYAVMNLLLQKSPRTTRELYLILEKKFTRKTLILTLRELSLDLNAIQPTHIRTEKGYGLGYRLNPKLKDIVRSVQKFSKTIENVRSV